MKKKKKSQKKSFSRKKKKKKKKIYKIINTYNITYTCFLINEKKSKK